MGFAVGTLFLQQGRNSLQNAQMCECRQCGKGKACGGNCTTAAGPCSMPCERWAARAAPAHVCCPACTARLVDMSVAFFSVMTQLVVSFAAPGLLIERLPVYYRQRNAHM